MWKTNLKIVLIVLATLGVYTGVANVIPQVESKVPERVEISADVSTEELVEMGEEIFHGAGGCEACHGLGTRAPRLMGEIGTRCGERVPELSCKEYLYQSLVDPGAYLVAGFQPIMPDIGGQLSDSQVWALVAFLESQGGEVTVTSEDLAGAGGAPEAAGAEQTVSSTPPMGAGGGDLEEPRAIMQKYGCLGCHVLDGEGPPTGPSFDSLRTAGPDPARVRRSILRPNADTTPGYEPVAGTMPNFFAERMTAGELERLVSFLAGGSAEDE